METVTLTKEQIVSLINTSYNEGHEDGCVDEYIEYVNRESKSKIKELFEPLD